LLEQSQSMNQQIANKCAISLS